MMLFKAGIYSALVSLSHGYLMPGQTDKIVYADTRILDPRYARSAENLVCQSEVTHDVMKHLPTGGGGKGGKPVVQEHTEMRAIGCCPAGDPNGTIIIHFPDLTQLTLLSLKVTIRAGFKPK